LQINAAWGNAEQPAPLVTAQARAAITDLASATALGEQVAAQLRAGGAS
jgi:hydroxymethylbilane synthase